MRCFSKVFAVLSSLLGACADEEIDEDEEVATFDTGAPSMLERRVTVRPPRRLETPTSGNDMDDEAPCSAGEERWERVDCWAVGYAGNPGYDENRGAWVCPRCYENVCGTSWYSEAMERDVLPSMIQLPTCSERMTPVVRR